MDNREFILDRVVDSEERGLLLSFPYGELYNYARDGVAELLVTVRNEQLMIQEIFIVQISTEFMGIVDTNNITQLKTYQIKGIDYVMGLTVMVNGYNSTIEFYDAYYNSKDIDEFNLDYTDRIPLVPFMITGMFCKGDQRPVGDPRNQDKIKLVVDDATGLVTGIIYPQDVLFHKRNGIIMTVGEMCQKIKSNNPAAIVSKYVYNDGDFAPALDENPILKVKKYVDELRIHQFCITDKALRYYFLHTDMDPKDIKDGAQKHVKEINDLIGKISGLRKEIFETRWKYVQCSSGQKYYCSLCLLIKDENEYIVEWLNHHITMGVDHFYIYDNMSEVPIEDTVRAADESLLDKCTFIRFNSYSRNMQYECYEDCLSDYGKDSKWIGFIDTDEFVFLNKSKSLKEFLQPRENYFGIYIPWEIYNSNGHIGKPDGSVIESYTRKAPHTTDLYGKLFVQPDRVEKMYVHAATPRYMSDTLVFENGDLVCDNMLVYYQRYKNGQPYYDDAYIAHYITRSLQEWCDKINRGTSDPNFKRKFDTYFLYNPEMSFLKRDDTIKKMLQNTQSYK